NLGRGPGVAPVSGLDESQQGVAAGPLEGCVPGDDQVGEVVKRAIVRIDDDDVADRLLPLLGVDDDLGLAPCLATVDRLGEVGGACVGRGVRVVPGVVRQLDQRVPHGVSGAGNFRVGGRGV